MKKLLLAVAVLFTGMVPSVSAQEFSKPAQSIAFNHDINVDGFSDVSMQVTFTSKTYTASTFTDGAFSTATITVSDYTLLVERASSGTVTLASGQNTSAIDAGIVTVNGTAFKEGRDFFRGSSSTATMKSLQLAIDAHETYTATVSSNVVTVEAPVSALTGSNSWTITSSVNTKLVPTGFGNGQRAGYISLNGITFTESVDFDAETSSETTATNLAAAINANATLAALLTAAAGTGENAGHVMLTVEYDFTSRASAIALHDWLGRWRAQTHPSRAPKAEPDAEC